MPFEDDYAQYIERGPDGTAYVTVEATAACTIDNTTLYAGSVARVTLTPRVKHMVRNGPLVLVPPN